MSRHRAEVDVNLPVITLKGSAFDRGYQHGERFALPITRAISRMKQVHSRAAYDKARVLALQSLNQLQAAVPAVAEEIRGIALGSKSDPIEIYCHIGFEFFDTEAVTGCSGVAIATNDGAIIGQNWDCPAEKIGDLALFLHHGKDGPELAMVATVGTLGWVGQNRAGLALLSMDVMLDRRRHGVPSQVMRRLMLGENDVCAALTAVEDLPVMAGRSYLLGDSSGSVAAIEVSPRSGICRLPGKTRHFHTNHALSSQAQAFEDEPRLDAVYPSSRKRLLALHKQGADASRVADLERVLSDRDNEPDSIAKTPSSREPTMTAFSIIFECGSRDFYLCCGPPAVGDYQHFRWTDKRPDETGLTGAQAIPGEPAVPPLGMDK